RHALPQPARLARSFSALDGARSGGSHRAAAARSSHVSAAARRTDVRLQRSGVRATHPAVHRSGWRPGPKDRLYQRGRLQPRRLGLAQRPAVPDDRARQPVAGPVLPRRQATPALRFRRERCGDASRAEVDPTPAGPAPSSPRRPRDRPPRQLAVPPGRAIRGYIFDAYGTLFDVHSVVEAGRAITSDPITLSMPWGEKHLEYTWVRGR